MTHHDLSTQVQINQDARIIPKRLDLFITEYYSSQGEFAESQGVHLSTVGDWLSREYIVVDGVLYAPKRKIK